MEELQHWLSVITKTTLVSVILAIFTYSLTSSRDIPLNTITTAADATIVLNNSEARQEMIEPIVLRNTPSEPVRPRDHRAIALEGYLSRQGSYLARYTDLIVELSDYYGVDSRLMVAIAGVESGYCKINFRPYNCWGYGKYGWASEEDGIRSYMAHMNNGYFSRGARTIEAVARIYNPNPQTYLQKYYIHFYQLPKF